MSAHPRLKQELKAVGMTTLYFGIWLGGLVALKRLLLAEYHIKFHGLSVALVGSLVIAKVVLLLEHVPLGSWIRRRPVLLEILVRTTMYAVGVLAVLLLEKAFEARHEYGGFGRSLTQVFHHRDIDHVWVNTICLAAALLGFNALAIMRRHLGPHGLTRLFLSPSPAEGVNDQRPASLVETDSKQEHENATSRRDRRQ